MARALAMEPLASNGQPDPEGAIVMISIGYSNMTQEWASGARHDDAAVS